MTRLVAFPWYGGKSSKLNWLLPLLPSDAYHYCEPFGGSASVLLNRAPSKIETFNDADREIVHFFRTLRDRPDELLSAVALTPHARDDFAEACEITDEPIERARRFLVRTCKSVGANPHPAPANWIRSKTVSRHVAKPIADWFSHLDNYRIIIERLLLVQIENRDALRLMRELDTPETVFYCDPPYSDADRVSHSNYYLDHFDPAAFFEFVRSANARIAISGYPGVYSDALSDWRLETLETHSSARAGHLSKRVECLWMNYDESGARIV